ncbi:Protein YOP1 [Ceratobasidium theobromae]|uniref:Protein YOP1 n=1 Tax=Ceratobasidium theobromae TaxID=1582974 RepID=A0A5N5QIB6_9AGAM|nr:Protein YOP1 [Ceratobasidium theobromae]
MSAQDIKSHPLVQQLSTQASYYVSQLDKELSKYPALSNLEQRTQIPKAYGVLGASALVVLLIFINAFASPVSNLIGWALPAYLSLKAIESPQPEDDVQWLTYWSVFGFFTFLESFALRIILYYLPFYYVFKTAFVLWLQLPATRGARTIHQSVLRPFVSPYISTGPAPADTLRTKVRTTVGGYHNSAILYDPNHNLTF